MKNSGCDVGTHVVVGADRIVDFQARLLAGCASERKKGMDEWTSPAGKILRFKRLENCPNCHAA